MANYEIVFIGIPEDLEARLLEYKHKSILVIDDKTMYQHHPGFDIHHPLTSTLYHISKDLSEHDTPSFEERASFYEQVILNYQNQAILDKQELRLLLADRGVDYVSGMVEIVGENRLKVSWLARDYDIAFDKAIFTWRPYYQTSYQNPFVFSFGDIIHFQELPKRIAVEMDSLEALELAHIWKRFGSEVSVLITENALLAIDSLYFRDGIRDRLSEMGINFYPKVENLVLNEQEETLKLTFNSMNQPQEMVVDAYFVKGELLDLNRYYRFNDNIEILKPKPLNRIVINLDPAFVQVNPGDTSGDIIIQKDASDITYFHSVFAFEGGIELTYSQASHKFVSGTFFCKHAHSIADSFELIKSQNLSLVDLAYAQYSSSIFSIFKEFALDILDEL